MLRHCRKQLKGKVAQTSIVEVCGFSLLEGPRTPRAGIRATRFGFGGALESVCYLFIRASVAPVCDRRILLFSGNP